MVLVGKKEIRETRKFMITFSDEQQAIFKTAKQFADHEMAEKAAEWDESSYFPKPVLTQAAELGFSGMLCDELHGGANLGRVEATLVYEALATACPTVSAYLSIHNMVAYAIDRFGDEAIKAEFLPDLIKFNQFSSYCLTEPQSGSDAASLRTSARKNGDDYVLNGTKAFISGGGVSDLYMVMARTGDDGADGISCFLVPKDTAGLSFGGQERKLGWKAQPTAMVFFEDCVIPERYRLGKEGQGFSIAMHCLDGGRISIAACSLGGAQACLDLAKSYLQTRVQFNKSLAEFQALQFKLADMATELEAGRLMVYHAAQLIDYGASRDQITLGCAMAKRFATDAGFEICNQALQLHGGYGYLKDFPIERYVRDLRVHQILEGTNEIMRVIIARHLLKS